MTLGALNDVENDCERAEIEYFVTGGFEGDSVIGHGIDGINFPDIVARLAKMQDHWSKR